MRRAVWCATVVGAVILMASPSWAIYTPNPAGRWAEGRFFLAGDLQFHEKDLDPSGELEDVIGFYARPGFSIARNIMIYGRFGFQDADVVDAGPAAGFGIQGAYVFPRHPEWAVGGAFDFLWWDTEIGDRNIDYTEFQISPAVSYNIPALPVLTPYAGFMLDFLGGDLEEDDPFGFVFGTNIDIQPSVRFDAQFRVLSETGIMVSAGYLF